MVIQTSHRLINISHKILIDPLLQQCRDSVMYVLKSGMLGSHRLGAITEVRRLVSKLLDGCACTVRWPAVLLKRKLVRGGSMGGDDRGDRPPSREFPRIF